MRCGRPATRPPSLTLLPLPPPPLPQEYADAVRAVSDTPLEELAADCGALDPSLAAIIRHYGQPGGGWGWWWGGGGVVVGWWWGGGGGGWGGVGVVVVVVGGVG